MKKDGDGGWNTQNWANTPRAEKSMSKVLQKKTKKKKLRSLRTKKNTYRLTGTHIMNYSKHCTRKLSLVEPRALLCAWWKKPEKIHKWNSYGSEPFSSQGTLFPHLKSKDTKDYEFWVYRTKWGRRRRRIINGCQSKEWPEKYVTPLCSRATT